MIVNLQSISYSSFVFINIYVYLKAIITVEAKSGLAKTTIINNLLCVLTGFIVKFNFITYVK